MFLLCYCSCTYARIGDTKKVAESRYDYKPSAYIKEPGGIEKATYNTGNMLISQYYLNGYCVRATYNKAYKSGTKYEILMDELKEIVKAETHGGKWKTIKKPNDSSLLMFDQKYAKFVHTNGTTMEMLRNKRRVDFVSPKYNRHLEIIAKKKEAERKRNISKF